MGLRSGELAGQRISVYEYRLCRKYLVCVWQCEPGHYLEYDRDLGPSTIANPM